MCYAHAWRGGGYGSEASRASLERLHALGVDAISLTPFGFQLSASSDTIRMAGHWGESDDALAAATRQAHALGIRVMLKPHIWIRGGAWIGDQTLPDDASWARWFASYRAFIVHYAALAEKEKMEALSLGTELKRASSHDRETWRAIIAYCATTCAASASRRRSGATSAWTTRSLTSPGCSTACRSVGR